VIAERARTRLLAVFVRAVAGGSLALAVQAATLFLAAVAYLA
jgi:hypothetical protein